MGIVFDDTGGIKPDDTVKVDDIEGGAVDLERPVYEDSAELDERNSVTSSSAEFSKKLLVEPPLSLGMSKFMVGLW